MRARSAVRVGDRPAAPLLRAMRTIAVAAVVWGLAAPAAHADGHSLQVSRDGHDWADSFSGALFEAPTVVPGDRLVRALHLRNSSDVDASVWLSLVDRSTPDSALARHLDVSAAPVGDIAAPVRLVDATGETPLMRPVELDAGDSVALEVAVEFGAVAGSRAQGGRAAFDLVVRLAERLPGPSASPTTRPAGPPASPDDLETAGSVVPSEGPTPSEDPSPATGSPPASGPSTAAPTTPAGSPSPQAGDPAIVVPGLSDDDASTPDGHGAPAVAGPAGTDRRAGLPDTGTPARLQQQTALAVGAVATGILLVAGSRRRRRSARAAR